jgi:hypothetical protein
VVHLIAGVSPALHGRDEGRHGVAGRYNSYWERGLKPWDLAAGVDGGDTALARGDVLAGNGSITTALMPLLAH